MKRIGYCLIRFLSALLGWLITCILILPVIPAWGSEGFRFLPWLLSILALIVIPLIVAFIMFFCIPLPDDSQPNGSGTKCTVTVLDSFSQTTVSQMLLSDLSDQYSFATVIHTKVAGVTFKNHDGSSRQEILSVCSEIDRITLDYFTYRGKAAYAVLTKHGQIGNLPAELAKRISAEYSDCVVTGDICEITGGDDGYYYGCEISITIYRKKEAQTDTDVPYTPNSYTGYALSPRNNPFAPPRVKPSDQPPAVSDAFIAEAQWYASRDESNDT